MEASLNRILGVGIGFFTKPEMTHINEAVSGAGKFFLDPTDTESADSIIDTLRRHPETTQWYIGNQSWRERNGLGAGTLVRQIVKKRGLVVLQDPSMVVKVIEKVAPLGANLTSVSDRPLGEPAPAGSKLERYKEDSVTKMVSEAKKIRAEKPLSQSEADSHNKLPRLFSADEFRQTVASKRALRLGDWVNDMNVKLKEAAASDSLPLRVDLLAPEQKAMLSMAGYKTSKDKGSDVISLRTDTVDSGTPPGHADNIDSQAAESESD